MNKILLFFILCISFNCFRERCVEYSIKNSTNRSLILKIQDKDTLIQRKLQKNTITRLYDVICDFEQGPLSFELSDSIYITDVSNTILKVYKEDTPGKNIYNTFTDDWILTRTDNFYLYEYAITEEDLE